MELQSCFIGTFLIIVTFGLEQAESGLIPCQNGEFYNSSKHCQTCATCQVNEIIRKPCATYADTQCGPFSEFMKFQQHTKNNKNKSLKNHHTKVTTELLPTTDSSKLTDLTSVSSSEEQWKTLAMGLIGVLCIVSVFLAMFVFAVLYVKYRRPIVEKDIVYDSDYVQSSETYVQVQPYLASRLASRDRLKNKSCTEYDSCSEDSYPYPVQMASSSSLLPPVFIPPVGDDYDADHSGASTIKSDYVYFNCPQNGNQLP